MSQITIQQFVNRHKITSNAEWVDSNPHMADMPRGSRHFKVTLKRGRKRLTIPFSQGPAVEREPEAIDVLSCLAMDAAGLENSGGFEEWAREYGYDTDSRKAEKTFKAVERQTDKLRKFLDSDQLDQLLWHTESL